jgi:CelD/BcsL family acetyltransferase involved in cellulose biosynthesis
MKLEIYEDSKGFDSLQNEWNALLQRSATNVLFLTWEWQRAWWDTFGAGKNLYLLAMRDDSGALEAIVPLFSQETLLDPHAPLPAISVERPLVVAGGEPQPSPSARLQRTVHLVGGTEVSDYLDIIAPAEWNGQACAVLMDALGTDLPWRILDLRPLPAASPTVPAIAELARARGWSLQQTREDVCPVLELPGTWEEYLATKLGKKQRHELRRKMRRAEQETRVDWHWVTADDFDQGLGLFIHLHKASHPDKDAFMDERMQGFFRDIARFALEKGWLRLSVLSFNGQPVASYLCFDYAGDRLIYNSGFDLTAYADLGPGIVLVGYMIEDAIQHGLKRFDFLQGNERYKYEFGGKDTDVLRLLVRR